MTVRSRSPSWAERQSAGDGADIFPVGIFHILGSAFLLAGQLKIRAALRGGFFLTPLRAVFRRFEWGVIGPVTTYQKNPFHVFSGELVFFGVYFMAFCTVFFTPLYIVRSIHNLGKVFPHLIKCLPIPLTGC